MDDYDRLFSFEEKKIFTIDVPNSKNIYIRTQAGCRCLKFIIKPEFFLYFLMKRGKAGVIAEALVCGIPVVVKKHLMGGGRGYLNDKNSQNYSLRLMNLSTLFCMY